MRPGPDAQWSPQVHSGFFYDKADEYYFYAKEQIESATVNEAYLEEPPRQGAPIIITSDAATPVEFRQVAFASSSTPVSLTLTNTETVSGSGTTSLFLAYEGVHSAEVVDGETGETLTLVEDSSETNELILDTETSRDKTYDVSYVVSNSFYVDYSLVSEEGDTQAYIKLDKSPGDVGATTFDISYESSDFDPATPVDVALNPFYTTQSQGFLYISFDEYSLESVRTRVNPSHLILDGKDRITVTVQALDEHGNPKPNVELDISSEDAHISPTSLVTNVDGYAYAIATSRKNLATNPSLEYSIDGWDTDAGGSLSQEGAIAHDGSKSLRVECTADGDTLATTRVSLGDLVEEFISVQGWVNLPSAGEFFFNLEWLDENEGLLQSADSASELLSSGWNKVTLSAPVVEGATILDVSFVFKDATTGEVFYIDEVLIEDSESFRDYIDDDTHPDSGTINISGDFTQVIEFKIIGKKYMKPKLRAGTKVDQIQADGESTNYVFGILEDESYTPISGETVNWKRARTIYDLFGGDVESSGSVTTDSNGNFLVGPFTAATPQSPGLWFVATDATPYSRPVGDVVFWMESPQVTVGVQNLGRNVPLQIVQHRLPVVHWPEYADGNRFTIPYYEGATPYSAATPDINWLPPTWYSIPKYVQYQLGIDSHEESEGI